MINEVNMQYDPQQFHEKIYKNEYRELTSS